MLLNSTFAAFHVHPVLTVHYFVMEALIWKLPKRRTVLQTERTCTVRVLNLSMIRTGTLSIKAALDILGIPTYHGVTDYIEKPEHQTIWNMAVDAKFYGKGREFGRDEFDCFLGDWAALSDFPTIVFAEDLIQAYPEVRCFSRRLILS